MAARSLTGEFLQLRGDFHRRRRILEEVSAGPDDFGNVLLGHDDDTVRLVPRHGSDERSELSVALPPEWTHQLEDINYLTTTITTKMNELVVLHNEHSRRPNVFGDSEMEHTIEILTGEITQMFNRAKRDVQLIAARAKQGTPKEMSLAKNVTSSSAQKLQELSIQFRKQQAEYLRRLRARDELLMSHELKPEVTGIDEEDPIAEAELLCDIGFTDQQMQEVRENTVLVAEREKEIAVILQSIREIHQFFQDIAMLVVEQGTVLDRIDYNIEHTAVRVAEGRQQLEKAEKHQKRSLKLIIIFVLVVIVIAIATGLILYKVLQK